MRRISNVGSVVDTMMIESIIVRNHLHLLGQSEAIYGGICPLCGMESSFTLWADKGIYRCFWCGCDGRFVMTPERNAELRKRILEETGVGES
jgi:Zn ribbon nucleic-acid-binding protein